MKIIFNKLLLFFVLTISTGNIFGQTCDQIPNAEYDALMALYTSTNPLNWTNRDYWEGPMDVCNWYGLNYKDYPSNPNSFVDMLSLGNNNLVGSIPATFIGFSELYYINLSNNYLSGPIPNIPTLYDNSNNTLLSLELHGNNYIFHDLEQIVYYFGGSSVLSYAPQRKVDQIESPSVEAGTSYTFTTGLISSSNIYQWYKDGAPIIGAESKDYTINSLMLADAGVYHVIATNLDVPDLTLERNPITLTVNHPPLSPGTIGSPQTICSNGDPGNFMSITSATGGDGSYVYHWLYSSDDGIVWNIIDGAILATYDPPPGLTASRWYRRGVTSNSEIQYTSSIKITVNPLPGFASGNGVTLSGSGIANLTAVPHATADNIRWYADSNGDTLLHTGTTYTTPTLNATTTYYVASYISATGCAGIDLYPITVTVNYPPLFPGTIGSLQTICENEDLAAFTNTTSASGGDGSFVYHWEYSINGGTNWTTISGETLTTYDPPAGLLESTWYRRGVTSNGETQYTPSIKITVNPTPGLASGNGVTLSGPGIASLTAVPHATADNIRWYVTSSGGASQHEGITFTTSTLNATTTYYVASYVNATGCEDTDRHPITVTVLNNAPIANAGGDVSIPFPISSFTLDGSLSLDSDGTIVSYLWTKVSGGTAIFNDANIVSPQVSSLVEGTYVFQLTVTDNDGATDSDTITVTVAAECIVPGTERVDLWTMYYETGGANWTNTLANNQPWDDNVPVCDWYGVTVTNGTVTALNLGNNNLIGGFTFEIGNLENLQSLILSHNQLTGDILAGLGNLFNLERLSIDHNQLNGSFPNLTGLLYLFQLDINDNGFVFSDLESGHPTYSTNVNIHAYSPQAKVDQVETINVTEGNPFTLNTSLTSLNNHYQWEFSNDGGATFNPIGTDSNTYSVSSATALDAGMYRFFATNNIVTGLTLERHTITINVNPDSSVSNICLSGDSSIVAESTIRTNLSLGMLDGSTINSVSATVLSGFSGSVEVPVNQSFDAQGSITFDTSTSGLLSALSALKINYIINSTSGSYQGTEIINSYDWVQGTFVANFECPQVPTNPNTFCLAQLEDYPIVANLTPGGNNIIWYSAETAGQQYSNTDEIIGAEVTGGAIYWWDDTTDGIATRTASTIVIYNAPEGDTEQTFSIYGPAPTILEIEVVNNGQPVFWYDSSTSTTALITSTLLVNGQTYYASSYSGAEGGNSCRFPVTITIGVIPPNGDPIQFLCDGSKLSDIVLQLESGLSDVWYATAEGGTPLDQTTTPVVNGITYYAAQLDLSNGAESLKRLAVQVNIIPVKPFVITETTQTFNINEFPTVENLQARGYDVVWYSQLTEGNQYGSATPLENGLYYAEQTEIDGPCPVGNRVGVTVVLVNVPIDPLLGCELFRPELDKRYVIDAWLNEREVTTQTISEVPFDNSPESELFVELLNHLKNRLLSDDEQLHDIPEVYEPVFSSGETPRDLAPLMAYIEGLGAIEKKLMVYDFKAIKDDYKGVGKGRTIGFSFYLNATKDRQIIYKTPNIVRGGVVETGDLNRYPLLDNMGNTTDEFLNFTKVNVIAGGVLEISADFKQILPPAHQVSQRSTFSASNIIKLTSSNLKYNEVAYQSPLSYNQAVIEVSFMDVSNTLIEAPIPLIPHGQIIDKWQKVTADFIIPGNAGKMIISLKNNDSNKIAYFDDLRILPFESNMKTFVYHPENQRLMSELDENNYATFYEYDLEGGLVRVKKETEEGIYTIQETRSGTIKKAN